MIARLSFLVKQHGDMEVFMDTDPVELRSVEEIDVDTEDTGIIFYSKEAD